MLLKCCLIHINTIILRHFFIFTIFVSMSRPRSIYVQKQPPRAAPRKRCSENIQQIYRRTPVPEFGLNNNFIEIALRHGCSPVNLPHIFSTPFSRNTSGWQLLYVTYVIYYHFHLHFHCD